MAPQSKKTLTVDGVTYDLATGRPVSTAPRLRPKRVDDMRAQRPAPRRPALSTALPRLDPKIPEKSRKPSAAIKQRPLTRRLPSQNQNQSKTKSFGSWVLLGSIMPVRSNAAWLLALIRSLLSPQTWFLAILPILWLQISLIGNNNAQEYLQGLRKVVDAANYQRWALAIGISLALVLLGVLVRSLTSSAGLYIRSRLLGAHQLHISQAFRIAAHNSLRQSLNYVLHLGVVVIISAVLLGTLLWLLRSQTSTLSLLQLRVIAIFLLVWIISLGLLYAKHWLQTGLLSIGPHSSQIQRGSYYLILRHPFRSLVCGLISILLSLGNLVIAIVLANWQLSYVVSAPSHEFEIGWLIGAAAVLFLAAALTGYIQLGLWSRYLAWLLARNPQLPQAVLAKKPTNQKKPVSIAPLFWTLYGIIAIQLLYMLAVVFYAPQIQNGIDSIRAQIPVTISPIRSITQPKR